jgi:hypothetical protein
MKSIEKLIQSRHAILFILAVVVLTHLPFMNEPPRSIHVWRQSLTLGMARNLYEEGMNPLKPKVDCRYETNGITGSHFLVYEWGLAALYKLFGYHEPIHRWYSLVWYLLTVAIFYFVLLQFRFNLTSAFAGSWMFAFSPELYYQGINAMPDVLALACALAGLYAFLHYRNNTSWLSYLIFLFCYLLAGLTKLQYLALAVPVAVIAVVDAWKGKCSKIKFLAIALGGGVISIIAMLWYVHAAEMIAQTGLDDVGLRLNIAPTLSRGIEILQQNVISDFPELLAGFASTVFVLAGLYFVVKIKPTNQFILPLLATALVLVVYHFLVLAQLGVHQYYMLPYLPLIFTTAAYGFKHLFARYKTVAFFLILLAPVFAMIRIIPARWSKGNEGILNTFYDNALREQISQIIPPDARVINGPDASNCINFYFTHTKGFGYRFEGDLFRKAYSGKLMIDDYISRGASYLIITNTADMNDERLRPYLGEVLYKNEELLIAKIARH